MHFGDFTDIKGISQDFSDCGLHNDKYTRFHPCEKCGLRADGEIREDSDFIVGLIYQPNKNHLLNL